jgi:hypothetical protein
MHIASNQTNVALAAFVTTYARLQLYRELDVLQERVLYYDTDSIIFVSDTNFQSSDKHPKTGDYLGDLTDELNGEHVVEFVSAGPKNYAKRLSDGSSECVVKGFSLNYIADLKVNFESIKNIVLGNQKDKISVTQGVIKRNRNTWDLFTIDSNKLYGMTYDKRILHTDYYTYPFGFKFSE